MRWCDAPGESRPHKTLYNRWNRWSEKGLFARILAGLVVEEPERKTAMIDAIDLKPHRTAINLRIKRMAAPLQVMIG